MNPDPIGDGCFALILELAKGNKTASGCVGIFINICTAILGYEALHETLLMTVDEKTATNWSRAIILGLVALYLLVQIIRRLKTHAQADDSYPSSNSSENID
jgi:hypothetical protein